MHTSAWDDESITGRQFVLGTNENNDDLPFRSHLVQHDLMLGECALQGCKYVLAKAFGLGD